MRFFFDIHNGTTAIDDEGMELEDIAAAILVARRTLASVAAETILAGDDRVSIDVRDDERVICSAVLVIDFRQR